MIVRKRLPDTM